MIDELWSEDDSVFGRLEARLTELTDTAREIPSQDWSNLRCARREDNDHTPTVDAKNGKPRMISGSAHGRGGWRALVETDAQKSSPGPASATKIASGTTEAMVDR